MIPLFDYQQRAVDEVYREFDCGRKRVLVTMPTGAGKSRCAGAIADRHDGFVLWIAHTTDLVTQPIDALREIGLDAGRLGSGCKIEVATVQSLLNKVEPHRASLLVFDEARRAAAAEWSEVIKRNSHARLVGLDATPERANGTGLGSMFDVLIKVISYQELVAMGRLVPCEVIAPEKVLKGGQLAQHPGKAYLSHAKGRRAILFGGNVAYIMQLTAELNAMGVRAAYVHGQQDQKIRERTIEEYRNGKYDVLSNVMVLTDGFDDPATSCILIARGCSTAGTYIQMCGRALRAAPGKKDALLIDLRGVSLIHGDPLEDRIYSLEGSKAIRRKEDVPSARYCSCCGAIWSGTTCAECGLVSDEGAPPRIMNKKLTRRVYLPGATTEAKVKKLAELIRTARAKGYKPSQPWVKFAILYGHQPTAAMRKMALDIAKKSR